MAGRQMLKRRRSLGMGLVFSLVAGMTAAEPAGTQDISGVWFGFGFNGPNGLADLAYKPVEGGDPPYTKRALALLHRRQAAEKTGHAELDPLSFCMPPGMPGIQMAPTPFQIIQTPGQVTIIQEETHSTRLIYLDEPQQAHPAPTFLGHSVGHWEGDTLVVDTTGIRENWLDTIGSPASGKIHVIEHFKKINDGKELQDLMTIIDPEMYTKPWTTSRIYEWRPKERIQEYICEENSRLEPGEKWGKPRLND